MRRSLWAVQLTHTPPLENLVAHCHARREWQVWIPIFAEQSPLNKYCSAQCFRFIYHSRYLGKKYIHANGRIKKNKIVLSCA